MARRVKDPASEEMQDEFGQLIEDESLDAEAAILSLIAVALSRVTTSTSASEIYVKSLSAERKAADILKNSRERMDKIIDKGFTAMAKGNEQWAKPYFDAAGIKPPEIASNTPIAEITTKGIEKAKRTAYSYARTSVTGICIGDSVLPFRDAYIKAVSEAATMIKVGAVSADESIRGAVSSMAREGLTVIDEQGSASVRYSKGGKREVYSAVRMNILREFNETMQEMREEQGKQFGADGYEVSAHALCAQDHIDIQGKQFPIKPMPGYRYTFDEMNSSLDRPIGTLNCKHTYYPVLIGVSRSTYSDAQLSEMRKSSREVIEFTGLSGKKLSKTRYEASQYQRSMETAVRKAATERDLLDIAKKDSSAEAARVKALKKDYSRICRETGLIPWPERMKSHIR